MAKVATQGLVSSNAVQYVAGPLKVGTGLKRKTPSELRVSCWILIFIHFLCMFTWDFGSLLTLFIMIGFLSVWNEGVGAAALGSPVSVLAVTNGAIERIPTVVDIMKKNVDEKVQSKC